MIKLLIDTRDNQRVTAQLNLNGNIFESVSTAENRHPESIIKLIDQVCTKANIDVQKIDEISVEEGPGSYTGLKVGVSVANALAFALNKKVNGRPIGELAEPQYE